MNDKPCLLVVDDDAGIREQLVWAFDEFEVVQAENRHDAIKQLRRFEPAVVTLDLGLPPKADSYEEGMQTLSEILQLAPLTKVIMVTGQSDKKIAIEAIGRGAYDFYVKPIEPENLHLIVTRAFYLQALEVERKKIFEHSVTTQIPGMLTASKPMTSVCKMIEKIAPNNVTTLLAGESGTGKEVLAKGIHHLSPRMKGPFIAINCAAIPENLLESELFGYEKGAFTGAHKQTKGKIELANEGTLFLDEIGDLPIQLQPKLLRFLQERQIERLGGRESIAVDVRVICATHQDLKELIATNQFREDLYYRLAEVTITIPPLREREEDILLLAKMFMSKYSESFKKTTKRFSHQSLKLLLQYAWPGNVRELENRVKRAVIMAEGNEIKEEDLDFAATDAPDMAFNLKAIKHEAEKQAIQRALNFSQGNVSKAAVILGVTRPTLYNLMEKLDIKEKEYTAMEGSSQCERFT
ncbi:PEP-CTERM-box response regulator transcription factor [Candidatus Berkiella cookevillensis]|uniref:PEP-CTERM-box response regulator transcription factor n=1 Tax=Candidatus Berkiella cookevillensis TaxID=437022 RepID=A0A0Q9YBA4_9GAMM|nr:PEP-CTERM-box response regulator transcription factor [Candidatus Berkiella cookevillensis]MCS5709146.1 PEP-CTERM-box response regulator transcription factor [Candidatus Berkiella cookevillensis]